MILEENAIWILHVQPIYFRAEGMLSRFWHTGALQAKMHLYSAVVERPRV